MDKDVYAHWPDVNAETLQAIGRFVVAWGVLEIQISDALGDLYDFDEVVTAAVTANLGTKAKLELFMAGIELFKDWIHPRADIRDLNKLATDTADIANKYRNLVAHGFPLPINLKNDDDEMFPKQHWAWARMSARKGGVKLTVYNLHHHQFELAVSETVKLIDRWTYFRLDVTALLSSRRSFLREQSDEPDR